MNTKNILSTVIRETGVAYALFDHRLQLTGSDFTSLPWFLPQGCPAEAGDIWTLFPELIGSEPLVDSLLAKRKKRFVLEKINKLGPDDRLYYADLQFMAHSFQQPASRGVLVLIFDRTSQVAAEQQLQQQYYELQLLRSRLASQPGFLSNAILGASPAVQEVRAFIERIANHNTTVLLQGETGTGKSLVARVIHNLSPRSAKPFVEINCAAIPDTLMESELFGYKKGAFTNAQSDKKGLIEEANGGTLFLDEIGEMPLSLQAKLLTFLEQKAFRSLGSTDEKRVDVRLIAATNRDLGRAVADNNFRQDLFYRINVVSCTLPPLREMDDDVLLLAEHFIELLHFEVNEKVTGLSPSARAKLLSWHWPGNVRELRNVIERAMIFARRDKIEASDLLLSLTPAPGGGDDFTLPATGFSLEEHERKLLEQALQHCRGVQSAAAARLGLSLDTFRYRIKKYDLNPRDYS